MLWKGWGLSTEIESLMKIYRGVMCNSGVWFCTLAWLALAYIVGCYIWWGLNYLLCYLLPGIFLCLYSKSISSILHKILFNHQKSSTNSVTLNANFQLFVNPEIYQSNSVILDEKSSCEIRTFGYHIEAYGRYNTCTTALLN